MPVRARPGQFSGEDLRRSAEDSGPGRAPPRCSIIDEADQGHGVDQLGQHPQQADAEYRPGVSTHRRAAATAQADDSQGYLSPRRSRDAFLVRRAPARWDHSSTLGQVYEHRAQL